jgi:hypothetical protein
VEFDDRETTVGLTYAVLVRWSQEGYGHASGNLSCLLVIILFLKITLK